jgi:molecular chaperone GrpE
MDDSVMSELPDNTDNTENADDTGFGDDSVGEALEGSSIEASSEMEDALRAATAALEVRDAPTMAAAASESSGSADKMTIELLSRELQDLKALYEGKLKEFDDQGEHQLRLQAEFDNFRRRGLKEKQESLKFGHQNLVKDLLSAVDNLERALEHGAQNAGPELAGLLDGVELVYREVLGALAKHGVKEIEAQGRIFDPADHEAMGQLPNSEVAPGTVLEVLQKGYVIHDRMLRPARVIVSREATQEEAGSGGKAQGRA